MLKLLTERLRAMRVTLCLPYLPGKTRTQILPIYEPEKGANGFGGKLKTELYALINRIRTAQGVAGHAMLESADGVLPWIDKLASAREGGGCPIGDAAAFLKLCERYGVPVSRESGRHHVPGGKPSAGSSSCAAPPPQQVRPRTDRKLPRGFGARVMACVSPFSQRLPPPGPLPRPNSD